jgi:hypothetical protein
MTTFPNSPRLLKGGIVVVDAESGAIQRVNRAAVQPRLRSAARCSRRVLVPTALIAPRRCG